jgi:hypothetical protein
MIRVSPCEEAREPPLAPLRFKSVWRRQGARHAKCLRSRAAFSGGAEKPSTAVWTPPRRAVCAPRAVV